MDYQEALTKLHSLMTFGIHPGLERIRELARRLGDPQLRLPKVIHVAGTNGKGSVCAMLEAILQAQGFKTGLFTSPHLHSHTERYRVNGQPMPEADFAGLFSRVYAAIEEMTAAGLASPTEFEAVTALALLWFAESGVDVAILEAGMGGRDDSTNIVEAPIAVITNIGMDHMAYLGNTIPDIAENKADIIKPGATAITAAEGVALDIIRDTAGKRGAELLALGQQIICNPLSLEAGKSCFDLHTASGDYRKLVIHLTGQHQLANAALAVQGAELAGAGENAIRRGLQKAVWPARLEIISKDPLILLDGAHNYQGMQTLCAALERFWADKRIVCVLAMLGDKEKEHCLDLLLPYTDKLIITRSPYLSRSGDWQSLADYAESKGAAVCRAEQVGDALNLALSQLPENGLLLVCGSLYMVAEARTLLLGEENTDDI